MTGEKQGRIAALFNGKTMYIVNVYYAKCRPHDSEIELGGRSIHWRVRWMGKSRRKHWYYKVGRVHYAPLNELQWRATTTSYAGEQGKRWNFEKVKENNIRPQFFQICFSLFPNENAVDLRWTKNGKKLSFATKHPCSSRERERLSELSLLWKMLTASTWEPWHCALLPLRSLHYISLSIASSQVRHTGCKRKCCCWCRGV